MEAPERFPKVRSPLVREENNNDDYVVTKEITEDFGWVFDRASEVEAVEKLHGTNCAICIDEHEHGGYVVSDAATRMGSREMNTVEEYGPDRQHHFISRGIQNAVQRGYDDFLADEYGTGWFFGELIGPKLHGNPHDVDEHLFVPFDWLRDKCEYESYGRYDTDKESLSEWFSGNEDNGIFSLFASRYHGQSLVESTPDNGTFIEGLIFVHPDVDGRIAPANMTTDEDDFACMELAKLRRDMFESFQNNHWSMTRYGH